MSINNNSSAERSRSIPNGWEKTTLGEVIDVFNQIRIPLSTKVRLTRKGKYPYYGASNIVDYIDEYIFDGIYLLFAEDGSVIDDNGNPFLQYVWGNFGSIIIFIF